MSQFDNSGFKTFQTGVADLTLFQRVKLSAGKLAIAGADEYAIGVVWGFVGASADVAINDHVTVRLLTAAGTMKAICGEAIAVGATLYGGADGKVVDTDGGSYTARFLALDAGSADGSIIEVLPLSLS